MNLMPSDSFKTGAIMDRSDERAHRWRWKLSPLVSFQLLSSLARCLSCSLVPTQPSSLLCAAASPPRSCASPPRSRSFLRASFCKPIFNLGLQSVSRLYLISTTLGSTSSLSEWSTMKLRILSLLGNKLSGPFPMALTKITTLNNLSLEANNFYGPIPSEIGNLVNLQQIHLSSNNFTGELPATLTKLTNLTDLRISGNNFSGRIPDFLKKLTKLEKLQMQGCLMKGPIPSSISQLTRLTDLCAIKMA